MGRREKNGERKIFSTYWQIEFVLFTFPERHAILKPLWREIKNILRDLKGYISFILHNLKFCCTTTPTTLFDRECHRCAPYCPALVWGTIPMRTWLSGSISRRGSCGRTL